MATLLPVDNAAFATCLSRCDFPAPAIPETSITRSRDPRMCSSALRCSSVIFAPSNSKARPIGSQIFHPARTTFRSCSSSNFACSVVRCEASSWMNRSLLTYCSTSSRDNLPHARLRISAVSTRSRATECLAKVGFDRHLARIDWQLELKPLLCSIWRYRVPPLRSHLVTPVLDLRLAVETLGCLAITLLVRNPPFLLWRRFPLFRQSVDQLISL